MAGARKGGTAKAPAPRTRRRKGADRGQGELLDITSKLKTAACVPALRDAVGAWRAGGYKGTTETTLRLLNHWFNSDHRLANGDRFAYHRAQRESVETLIFVWEVEKVRTRTELLERYALDVKDIPLPPVDDFARYCVKMATGSGKTKVMSLAIAWQFLNAQRETDEIAREYAKTFLLLAPNVIVFERLASDFGGGRIFEVDPIVPRDMRIFWEFDCVLRGAGERAHAQGALFLTNIQQFYERSDRSAAQEPDAMTAVLGSRPPAKKLELTDFGERIRGREGQLMVLNDEAHHTHQEDSEWNNVIRRLHDGTPLALQLDLSATPRFNKGGIFPWTISDYPLKQAILDRIVKRPMRGVAKIEEKRATHASIRYEGYLVAGVERWKEYRQQLGPLGKKPVLFIMLNGTDEADDVGDWLRKKYPQDLGADKTLVIHTDSKGDIKKDDLEEARKLARDADSEASPVSAIVSVLMLREGWDVQNVTVVVGLRPYTAKANILPEQAIGRGLRLMFRGDIGSGYQERVDIIGNQKFLEFVDDLEKLEEIQFGTFEVGKERLKILSILPLPDRAAFDISVPTLSPVLVRKKSLADEIAALDPASFNCPVLPLRETDAASRTFTYEGFDVITDQKEIERRYTIEAPQTAQEVIGFYARRIAERVKLPAQFAALAPKVREFFEKKAFGKSVSLDDSAVIKAMATPQAAFVVVNIFQKVLRDAAIAEREPELLAPPKPMSSCPAFPWSRAVYEARKTVFNLVPCDNEFEKAFARFLDGAADVAAFAKIPMSFGFSVEYLDAEKNLRLYYPDFIAVDTDGGHWLLETKGQETAEVTHKEQAAALWCENATALTKVPWTYRRVMQKQFEQLEPRHLADLAALDS